MRYGLNLPIILLLQEMLDIIKCVLNSNFSEDQLRDQLMADSWPMILLFMSLRAGHERSCMNYKIARERCVLLKEADQDQLLILFR